MSEPSPLRGSDRVAAEMLLIESLEALDRMPEGPTRMALQEALLTRRA